MEQDNIYSYVKYFENIYRNGSTQMSKYVNWSLSETVQKIYAYLNSKHISGAQDSLGRDKPFFNIVIAARNVWFRATDIDRKDINIRQTSSKNVISAFLAKIKLQDWMRRERFGVFLNEWGMALAGFGSSITKWVRQGDRLIPMVVPFNQIMFDAVDFDNNPKIEVFEFTPSQLRANKNYDQNMVEALIKALTVRQTLNGQIVDVKPGFVKIYEAHGKFPKYFLTKNDEDKSTFTQQMHVVSYVRAPDGKKEQNFTLYSGPEDKDPYRIDHLLREEGRSLSIGSVEHLFQSQRWTNHSVKAMTDQLDLASKILFQTSDPRFVGLNALTNIENGQILLHNPQEELRAVPNGSHDLGSLQAYMDKWKVLGQEINGISDAMLGAKPNSGTAWRLQNAILTQSQLLFDLMRQNKGLAIEDMMREEIIPFIKTELDTSDEIVATLEDHEIKRIDSIYVPQEATKRFNRKVIDQVLKTGQRPMGVSLQNEMATVQAEQDNMGNVRFFKPSDISQKTWDEIFKDLEWEIEVDVTGEASDTTAILETLNTALQVMASPGFAQNPQAQMIVNKILLETGKVSPLEISTTPSPTAPPTAPAAPAPSSSAPPAAPVRA